MKINSPFMLHFSDHFEVLWPEYYFGEKTDK